jgi:hypothetical protein
MQFHSSRLKVDRANKHIEDIDRSVRNLSDPDAHVVTTDVDPHTGQKFIHYDIPQDIPTNLALMIGDAVHNLRTALDYAWLQTLERVVPSAVSDFAQFPIYSSLKDLETALKTRKIDTASPRLYELIISHIKPYGGGDHSLWSIHKLDIFDKQRLLIPVVAYAGADGIEIHDAAGNVCSSGTWGVRHAGRFTVELDKDSNIKNKGKLNLEIVFDEGLPTKDAEVFDTLSMYGNVVLKIVELLEQVPT